MEFWLYRPTCLYAQWAVSAVCPLNREPYNSPLSRLIPMTTWFVSMAPIYSLCWPGKHATAVKNNQCFHPCHCSHCHSFSGNTHKSVSVPKPISVTVRHSEQPHSFWSFKLSRLGKTIRELEVITMQTILSKQLGRCEPIAFVVVLL